MIDILVCLLVLAVLLIANDLRCAASGRRSYLFRPGPFDKAKVIASGKAGKGTFRVVRIPKDTPPVALDYYKRLTWIE